MVYLSDSASLHFMKGVSLPLVHQPISLLHSFPAHCPHFPPSLQCGSPGPGLSQVQPHDSSLPIRKQHTGRRSLQAPATACQPTLARWHPLPLGLAGTWASPPLQHWSVFYLTANVKTQYTPRYRMLSILLHHIIFKSDSGELLELYHDLRFSLTLKARVR